MDENEEYLRNKIDKIRNIFSSLAPTSAALPWNSNDENVSSDKSPASRTHPHNHESFYHRISSFSPGLWSVWDVNPLECARWGWEILERDVIQCITCREVVCAILPDPNDREAYEMFLQQLKDRLITGHRDACGWRHNPSPEEFTQPPHISSLEHLRNLTNAAHCLAAFNSALPHIENEKLIDDLGADEELIKGLFSGNNAEEEVRKSCILLVLCGWTRGQGAYLKCKVCRRSIGLWNFYTRADEIRKTGSSGANSQPPSSRKRKKTNSDSDDDEARGNRDNDDDQTDEIYSPKRRRFSERLANISADKVSEETDQKASKGKKTKVINRDKSDDSNEQEKEEEEESSCPLIIGSSPSTQIKKVENKQYFHPLEEHRHWCTWVMPVQNQPKENEEFMPELKGCQVVTQQSKIVLQLSRRKDLCSSEKYAKNVDGLRLIRSLLNDVAAADDKEHGDNSTKRDLFEVTE